MTSIDPSLINDPTAKIIQEQIHQHPLCVYMKGSADHPQCGYSHRLVQCLKAFGLPFYAVNVLENPDIRRVLPMLSQWPTFPQLYVKGELIGGCDIVSEMYQNGELRDLLVRVGLLQEHPL